MKTFTNPNHHILGPNILQRNIKIVLLLTTKGKKVSKSLLYSTDKNLDASKIVQYYKLRFYIEFIFRDEKQHLGLTNFQTCEKEAINIHINTSFTTLNLLKLIDLSKNIYNTSMLYLLLVGNVEYLIIICFVEFFQS